MDGELTCPICYEYYNDPVILPCAHSFCRECVRSTFTVNKEQQAKRLSMSRRPTGLRSLSLKSPQNVPMPCPSCRKQVDLSPNDIDSMQSNFLLRNIVKKYKESSPTLKDAFDVTRTTLNNNGYVHMASPESSVSTNSYKPDEEIIYENPYMTMDGPQSLPTPTNPETEDHYAIMDTVRENPPKSTDSTDRPPILSKSRRHRSISVYDTTLPIPSSVPQSPRKQPRSISEYDTILPIPSLASSASLSIPPLSEENQKRKSVGMFDLAGEVASKASNRPRPRNLPPNRSSSSTALGKRHSDIPINGPKDWRSGAIRRKSQPDPRDLLNLQFNATLSLQTENEEVSYPVSPVAARKTGNEALIPTLAGEVAAHINRRKTSAPEVRPKPRRTNSDKAQLARRSKTLDLITKRVTDDANC